MPSDWIASESSSLQNVNPDSKVMHSERIAKLQRRLDLVADAKVKAWWERYLKRTIPFRGVRMASIRSSLHAWLMEEGANSPVAMEVEKALAFHLLRETFAEDKLAGILLLQEVLLPSGMVRWREDLPRFASLFQQGYIHEWNTCDWLCVKVLGPLAQLEGEPCARAISEWRMAEGLWQRRASGVAFVNLASAGEQNFIGFVDMLLDTCESTIRSSDRFAQTATGWVLRELSRAEPERVTEFISTHIRHFSRDALRRATAQLHVTTRAHLKEMHR